MSKLAKVKLEGRQNVYDVNNASLGKQEKPKNDDGDGKSEILKDDDTFEDKPLKKK